MYVPYTHEPVFMIVLFISWNRMGYFVLPAVAGRVLQNSVCPSFRPSFCLSGRFFGIVSVFSNFWLVARNLYEVVLDTARFSGKNFCLQYWENGRKMGQKQGFLNLLKNVVINFVLNLFYNENLYYLLCSCTNLIALIWEHFYYWDIVQNVLIQSDCRLDQHRTLYL